MHFYPLFLWPVSFVFVPLIAEEACEAAAPDQPEGEGFA